jgi:ATP-dependent helicase HrpB
MRRDALLRDVDLRSRVALIASDSRSADVDRDALRRVREQAQVWRSQLRVSPAEVIDDGITGRLLAFAYPERVAQRRFGEGDRYLMRNGTGAVLDQPGVLAGAPYLVIADLDGRSPQSRIYLAAPLDRADLDEFFAADVEREDIITWDASAGIVTAVRREQLGAIVLRERPLREPDADTLASVLLDAIARGDSLDLLWSESVKRLQDRVAFLRSLDSAWPDLSTRRLLTTVTDWLRPHLMGLRRRSEVERLDLNGILLEQLTWEQRRRLDELAPTHLVMPTGSRIAVNYADLSAPSIAVRLQELFGQADTPRIAGGLMTVTLHLLSPAHRPVQVTRDLAGFWRSSYFDVRKDLRGRYPKHEWPEDPMSATPTTRAKRRGV